MGYIKPAVGSNVLKNSELLLDQSLTVLYLPDSEHIKIYELLWIPDVSQNLKIW